MKRSGFIFILLIGLLICATACSGGASVAPTPTPSLNPHTPTVGYVPQGWTQAESKDFKNCVLDYSCAGCGMLQVSGSYTTCNGTCFVGIIYCPIPESYRKQYENNTELMKHVLAFRWNASNLADAETMTIDGQPALKMSNCNASTGFCIANVVCVKDATVLDILAGWKNTSDGTDIMNVINSIKF